MCSQLLYFFDELKKNKQNKLGFTGTIWATVGVVFFFFPVSINQKWSERFRSRTVRAFLFLSFPFGRPFPTVYLLGGWRDFEYIQAGKQLIYRAMGLGVVWEGRPLAQKVLCTYNVISWHKRTLMRAHWPPAAAANQGRARRGGVAGRYVFLLCCVVCGKEK